MIRWLAIVVAALALCAGRGAAQQTVDTVPIAKLQKNFAVPEAPAFSLLDVDSSKILRPTTPRDLGVEIANAAGGVGIPSALAVEFSPAMLILGGHLSIKQYAKYSPLYGMRLSLATKRDSTTKGRTQLAFGLRSSLYDASDPRTSTVLRDSLNHMLGRLEQLHNVRDNMMRASCVQAQSDTASAHQKILAMDASEANANGVVDCLVSAHYVAEASRASLKSQLLSKDTTAQAYKLLFHAADSVLADAYTGLSPQLKQYDSAFKSLTSPDSLWNKNAVDVALAMRASSADSLGHGLLADNYSAWATVALGYQKWLWWFLGAQAAADRDTTSKHEFRGSGHFATRVYGGSNAYRAYLEAQLGAAIGNRASWTFTGGGELSLGGGFWTTFGVGWTESGPRTGRVVSRLGVKAGIPGAT